MKFPALPGLLAVCVKAAPLSVLDTELRKTRPENRTINIVFHGHSVPSGYFASPVVRLFDSCPHLFHRDLKARYPDAAGQRIAADAIFAAFASATENIP